MQALELEIKHLIIDTLNLEDVKPEDIATHDALFVDGLGLDSIDALELGLALQQRYGISLSTDSKETRKIFASVHCLAKFITANGKR